MSEVTWLRTSYYVLAVDVVIGDITPWGEVVAVIPARGFVDWTHITFRADDGMEHVQLLGHAARIPLVATCDPIGRGAPPWCWTAA